MTTLSLKIIFILENVYSYRVSVRLPLPSDLWLSQLCFLMTNFPKPKTILRSPSLATRVTTSSPGLNTSNFNKLRPPTTNSDYNMLTQYHQLWENFFLAPTRHDQAKPCTTSKHKLCQNFFFASTSHKYEYYGCNWSWVVFFVKIAGIWSISSCLCFIVPGHCKKETLS